MGAGSGSRLLICGSRLWDPAPNLGADSGIRLLIWEPALGAGFQSGRRLWEPAPNLGAGSGSRLLIWEPALGAGS